MLDPAPRKTVTASKEVILSAGAFGSPHILLHSGIGGEQQLKSVGIHSILNLPDVSQHLSDHPLCTNSWFVRSNATFEAFTRNPAAETQLIRQWNKTHGHTGPLVDPFMSHLAWLRLPSNWSIFKNQTDPAAGPNTAHFEFVIQNGIIPPNAPATGNFISISTGIVTPVSRECLLSSRHAI